MFRKRTVLIISVVGLIFAAGLLGFLLAEGAHKTDGDGRVTRFEWIKMLGEQFGTREYSEDIPFFQDVDRQNGYFAYVQSAVEWEILEKEENFYGDEPVTGEFAVVTAMRAMGKYRVQIYLESDKEPDTSDYLRLAYEYELITEERLDAELDETECSAILETVQNLNTRILWKDDYVKVVSKENVLEVEPENIFGYDAETGQARMDPAVIEKVEAGDIIVFDIGYAGLKTAGKVETLDSSGTVTISRPSVDEVFDVLVLSDVVSLSEDDFTLFYELDGKTLDAGQGRSSLLADDAWQDAVLFPASNAGYRAVPAASFSAGLQNKGISFFIISENNLVKIRVTDNNTGASLEQSFAADLTEDTSIECSFEIKDIDVGAQVLYGWGSLKYIDVQLYACLEEKINVSVVSEEVEIPLGTLTIPLAGGIASVQLQLNLVLSMEGDILITAEIPAGAHFAYEAKKGLRSIPMNLSYTEPQIELSAEMEATVCPKAVLTVLLLWDAAEIDLKAGVSAGAEMVLHSAQTCTDLFVACPVISLGVTVDPLFIAPLSAEWDVIEKEDAPFQWGRHYEVYLDGSAGFVKACTYEEQKDDESIVLPLPTATATADVNLDNTYTTCHGDVRFAFDYPDTWKISEDESGKIFADEDIHEWVALKNERGAAINYYEWKQSHLGGGGHADLSYWEASKAADSSLDSFVVGKVQETGWYDMITGEEHSEEDGSISYVVMPQADVGMHTGTGFSGLYDSFTFSYGTFYYFIMATAPDGKFTEDEEREVLAILSSFRLAENIQLSDASTVTDDSEPVKTIEELWEKLDGIWVFEEYTYNGETEYYPEHTMAFSYTDDTPCMHLDAHSDTSYFPDELFYEISAIDAEHYDLYYYKKGSYNGAKTANWGSDTLACWYSIDLTGFSNGELIISPHIMFSDRFIDNYSVFRYKLEDGT